MNIKSTLALAASATLVAVQAYGLGSITLANPSFEADGTTKIASGFSTITGCEFIRPCNYGQ